MYIWIYTHILYIYHIIAILLEIVISERLQAYITF